MSNKVPARTRKYRQGTRLISAISTPITPAAVEDADTREPMSSTEWVPLLDRLMTYVRDKTETSVEKYHDVLTKALLEKPDKDITNPNGFAFTHGINPDVSDYANQGGRQSSRVQKLIQHNMVTQYGAYVRGTDPNKKSPTYSRVLNFGAVDKQMATRDYDPITHTYEFTTWLFDRHVRFYLTIPAYVQKYNITRWCLPTIVDHDVVDANGKQVKGFAFIVSFEEGYTWVDSMKGAFSRHTTAGVDCGVRLAIAMTVKTEDGRVVAEYNGSSVLRALNDKRNRLREEKRRKQEKLGALLALHAHRGKRRRLRADVRGLSGKIRALGRAIAQRAAVDMARICVTYGVDVVFCENLRWVSAAKGSSRWNYADLQDAAGHALMRVGVRLREVCAAGTSKVCSGCGSSNLVYNSRTRVLVCLDCGLVKDRDASASSVIDDRGRVPLVRRVRAERTADRCRRETLRRLRGLLAVRRSGEGVCGWRRVSSYISSCCSGLLGGWLGAGVPVFAGAGSRGGLFVDGGMTGSLGLSRAGAGHNWRPPKDGLAI